MRLELISPTCDLITPENAGDGTNDDSSPPVRAIACWASASAAATATRCFASTAITCATRSTPPSRATATGAWSYRAARSATSDSDSERYTYDVLVESRLRLEARQDHEAYFAWRPDRHLGDPFRRWRPDPQRFGATFAHGPRPVAE